MAFLIIVGVILLIVAGVALWKRRSYSQRMNILRQAVPASTSDVANAFPGEIVSISGTARNEQPLVSEQTQTPSIYYDFEIVRRYERNRGGGFSVGPGRRRRRRGRQRGRETVAENKQWVPFVVEDQNGRARVYPDGAYFEARQVLNRYEREGGNNMFGIPGLEINIGMGNRTLGYEIKENVIPADSPVFVAGPVDENGHISCTGKSNGMIVSHRNEATLREEWGNREKWQLYGAVAAGGIGMLMLFAAGVQWIVTSV